MSDYYMTKICIPHENKHGELHKLNQLIRKWTNQYGEYDYSDLWLGNIIFNSGIGTANTGKSTDFECSGSLLNSYVSNNCLYIITETVDTPLHKMWQKVVDKYIPSAKITYSAKNFRENTYITDNLNHENHYIIDVSGNVKFFFPINCASERRVVEILQAYLKTDKSDINELLQDFGKLKLNNIYIAKWKIVPADCWY